jgi:hypothetical protein
VEPLVGPHGGRLIKTIGDGFLSEFSSVIDAVSSAAVMQQRIAGRDVDQPRDVVPAFPNRIAGPSWPVGRGTPSAASEYGDITRPPHTELRECGEPFGNLSFEYR